MSTTGATGVGDLDGLSRTGLCSDFLTTACVNGEKMGFDESWLEQTPVNAELNLHIRQKGEI